MPVRRSRDRLVLAPGLALAAAGLLAACVGPASAPAACGGSEDCPAGSRCLAGTCVANAPPTPALSLPLAPEANQLVAFDASGSGDPDEGDAVVSFAWSFRSVSAPCAPPVAATSDARAVVRFGCPGRFAAEVTAIDTMTLGATRTEELDVAPPAGPPLVEVGPDVAVEHACTALQARCTAAGEVRLSAAAPSLDAEALSFSWSVEPPPDRPLDAGRRVRFSPDARAAAPAVVIETDGTAISGDWIFRVEVRDAAGVVGTGATRVSVGNRPPVLNEIVPVPDHAFDGARLTAQGEIRFTVSDPDNDAVVTRAPEFRHAADGNGTFGGELRADAGRIAYEIAVPWTGPEAALHLIGGEGLERAVVLAVEDANGGVTTEAWRVVVGNRPPALVETPPAIAVDHFYDPAAARYRAVARLSTWTDPDGDPLVQVPGSDTRDPACPTFAIVDDGGARLAAVECSAAYTGAPSLASFAGSHVVIQHVQDPWAAAPPAAASFTIGNRAPTVSSQATHVVAGGCTPVGCCRWSGALCTSLRYAAAATTTTIASRWEDPDGDPLEAIIQAHPALTSEPIVCTPPYCALPVAVAAMTVCSSETLTARTATWDGVAASPLVDLPLSRLCGVP